MYICNMYISNIYIYDIYIYDIYIYNIYTYDIYIYSIYICNIYICFNYICNFYMCDIYIHLSSCLYFRLKLPRHDCGPSTVVKKQPTQQGEDWFLVPQASKPWALQKDRYIDELITDRE